MSIYILDACAVIKCYNQAEGGEIVNSLYISATNNEITLKINTINLLEVYYTLRRKHSIKSAETFLESFKASSVIIIEHFHSNLFLEIGRIKSSYNLSLADSIAMAETVLSKGTLVTSDKKCFQIKNDIKEIPFLWV
ncbi:MAG: PIN domain-containing protein [Holophagaceae bacterium]|nr:PIN domain-containing protein [Holophagaceae bacterium]